MPRPKKVKQVKQEPRVNSKPSEDYEQFLIDKISRCQRIASGLKESSIWQEIREDYRATANSLDLAWAFEDASTPRFKHMQVTKMAATTFMNLQENYEHDLKMAQTQLEQFRNPRQIIKKDFDEEGVEAGTTSANSTLQETAYHGRG